MQNLADIVMGTVQYNEEGVLMSISELCGVMTNKSEAYEEEMEAYGRLVKLAQVWKTHSQMAQDDLLLVVFPPRAQYNHQMSPLSHFHEFLIRDRLVVPLELK